MIDYPIQLFSLGALHVTDEHPMGTLLSHCNLLSMF